MPGDVPVNDNDEPEATVFIIIGKVSGNKGEQRDEIHILLVAPDDDSAVRETLNALAQEGYAEADLDQIGIIEAQPDEEPHASAYQGALEGEVAIITFN